jgi:galactoside O-acetyltransferase
LDSFYSQAELQKMNFKMVGENVLISKKASIYGIEDIIIGNNVRIDDFCILSGKIIVGNYIHIAAYSALYGGMAGIEVLDFANISSRVTIYALSDDFSGKSMTNPMIPNKYKNVIHKKVIIEKHVIIGSNVVVLPGVRLKEGSAIGAMSLVNKDTNQWTINAGIPLKKIRNRDKELLKLEEIFISENM